MHAFVVLETPPEHRNVESVLGRRWLSSRLTRAFQYLDRRWTIHPASLGEQSARFENPLVAELYHSRIEAAQGMIGRHTTPLIDYLEHDLDTLSGIYDPLAFRPRLRNSHDCEKAAYELRIAAGFKRLGYHPRFVDPSGVPSPEFLLNLDEQVAVAVECKKRDELDGYDMEANRFWRHIAQKLVHTMETERLNYWVKISGRRFPLSDVDSLVAEIASTIKGNERGQFLSRSGRQTVAYLRLCDEDEEIPAELVALFPEGRIGLDSGKQGRGRIGTGPLKNPKLLRLELEQDLEHQRFGVVRNLKRAAHQLSPSSPNLVYLDVNVPTYQEEQDRFSLMHDAVERELSKGYRRMTAVILTNIYPALSLDGTLGWRFRCETVWQTAPRNPLPANTTLIGGEGCYDWIPGRHFVGL